MSFFKAKLKNLLCEDIEVSIQEGHFEFRRGRHVKLFEPAIYVPDNNRPENANAVTGNPPEETYIKVNPFSNEYAEPPVVSRQKAIDAFIARGFAAVTKRIYLKLPVVYFYGVEKITDVFPEFENSMLSDAARSAGARKCIFIKS